MRRFDNRRQLDNESLQEYEQALRLIHREAWPSKTNEQRDSELKRRFEDGLSNTEMTQYLRLHARDCDFSATVLKARQYADAAETRRPKKTVRIIKKPSQIIEPSADEDETVGFQPLIEDIRDAIRDVLAPAAPSVTQVTRSQHSGRQGRNQNQSPQESRAQPPAPPDKRPVAGCLTAPRPDNRQSRPMDRGNQRFNRPQVNGRFNSPVRSFQSPGPRPQPPGPRFQPEGQRFQPYERPNYQPHGQRFQPPGRPNFQPPGRVNFQDQRQDYQRSRSPAPTTYYNQQEFQGRRSPSPAPRYDRAPTPRFERDQPQDCHPVGQHQSYQDRDEPQAPFSSPPRSPLVPRRIPSCYVCGRPGCHSDRHQNLQSPPTPTYNEERADEYLPPMPPRQGNEARTPTSGDRGPDSRQ